MINRARFKTLRVHLEYVDAEDQEARLNGQMLLDVPIDEGTLEADGKTPCFGLMGSPIGEKCYPFVLRADGVVDFGNNSETHDRYHRLNIAKRRLEAGQMVTYTDDDGEHTYRVRSVD